MKPQLFIAMILGLAGHTVAHASDGQTLLQNNGCLSCHAKAEKVVGPSYLSIAEKYKGDKDAVATLVQSIQNGSRGKWGRVPMPAHASMSQDDLKSVARHILSTQP